MKKITLFLLLSMVITFSAEAHKYKNRKSHVTISIQTFYDQLSPYGDWIYTPDYGYVWRPYFDNPASFRPYSSNGNWVYTDYGWTWASGYDWGWATFHYGRWDFDNYLGWTWIPGYEWAPAWVSWGSYDNYYGWAPMGPNIYVHSNWYAPDPWWTFVPRNRFCSGNWNRYIYDRPVHVTHITHITNVYVNGDKRNNHNSWYNGPRVNEVERYNRGKVRRVDIVESDRPSRTNVQNNRLTVYRPSVDNSRKDTKPREYRNVEQTRTGKRIDQTNARTNDPGVNRTRESSTVTRSNTTTPAARNANAGRETRPDARTSGQKPGTRSSEATRENPRTTPQTEKRNSSAERETRIETRNGSQGSVERNSNRPSGDLKREPAGRGSNTRITEGNRTSPNPSRIENSENRQNRSNTPTRENVNNNSSRESGNREATSTQPTREQRTQNASPSSNSRTENTERQQTSREQVREAEQKSANESPAKRSSGSQNRR